MQRKGEVRVPMLALPGARLFDGLASHVVHRPLVLIEDGRIRAIEAGIEPPAEAEVAELGDVTLLPGLIDTHVARRVVRVHGGCICPRCGKSNHRGHSAFLFWNAYNADNAHKAYDSTNRAR